MPRAEYYLLIDQSPSLAITTGESATRAAYAAGAALAYPVLGRVPSIQAPLILPQAGLDAELANLTLPIRDPAGTLARQWQGDPPVRSRARLYEAGHDEPVFTGTITRLTLAGMDGSIAIEGGAQGASLLDPVPIGTTASWGEWQNVQGIPWVYGRVTLSPIPYDGSMQRFVIAGHAIAGVERVTRNDKPTEAYAWAMGTDSAGQVAAFLDLAEPLRSGERLAVTVSGRLSERTGAALRTAQEIAADLLPRLGLPCPDGSFDALGRLGQVPLGLTITNPEETRRAVIDRLAGSIGCAWSAHGPQRLIPWPPSHEMPGVDLPQLATTRLSAESDADLATALELLYDYDDATQRYRAAIRVSALDAMAQHGRLLKTWHAAALRTERDALALANRLLAWLARPRWRVSMSVSQAIDGLTPGQRVNIQHRHSPAASAYVMAYALDHSNATMAIEAVSAVGDAPAVYLERLSRAFVPSSGSAPAIDYQDGEAIITLNAPDGKPLAGARAIVLGKTYLADARGRLRLRLPPGKYRIKVMADGYAPMELEIEL